jgi:hypothetical protein
MPSDTQNLLKVRTSPASVEPPEGDLDDERNTVASDDVEPGTCEDKTVRLKLYNLCFAYHGLITSCCSFCNILIKCVAQGTKCIFSH